MPTEFLGIDLGGNSIKAGLVSSDGSISNLRKERTEAKKGFEHVLNTLLEIIANYRKNEEIRGIGLSLPGAIDSEKGICIFSPNLNWHNIRIQNEIEKIIDLPLKIINDADAACLGEKFLLCEDSTDLLMLTFGTGIGFSYLKNGEIFFGSKGFSGEAGHMTVRGGLDRRCTCGRHGCWESKFSKRGILELYSFNLGQQSATANYSINSIMKDASRGESVAIKTVTELQEILTDGLANLINILYPELIILGGGIMEAGSDFFLPELEKKVKKIVYPPFQEFKIIKAKAGNNAGIIGAASLFFNKDK